MSSAPSKESQVYRESFTARKPSAPKRKLKMSPGSSWNERTEAQLFKFMAEYSVNIPCRLSLGMQCTYVSPSATNLLGWTVKEVEARFPFDSVHPEDLSGTEWVDF